MNRTIGNYLPIVFLYMMSAYFLLDTKDFTPDSLLYPKSLSYILIALNTMLLVSTVAKRIAEPKESANRVPRKFLIVLLASVAYTICIKPLGFAVSSIIYCPLTALMLGYEKKTVAFITSATVIIIIYVGFRFILKVPLPTFDLFGITI